MRDFEIILDAINKVNYFLDDYVVAVELFDKIQRSESMDHLEQEEIFLSLVMLIKAQMFIRKTPEDILKSYSISQKECDKRYTDLIKKLEKKYDLDLSDPNHMIREDTMEPIEQRKTIQKILEEHKDKFVFSEDQIKMLKIVFRQYCIIDLEHMKYSGLNDRLYQYFRNPEKSLMNYVIANDLGKLYRMSYVASCGAAMYHPLFIDISTNKQWREMLGKFLDDLLIILKDFVDLNDQRRIMAVNTVALNISMFGSSELAY